MKIEIFGAGMAGLLAANMLKTQNTIIRERQSELPNNHHALLRFRTDKVADALGIEFEKVKVSKLINSHGYTFTEPNLVLNNMYSQKVTGSVTNRSVMNLDDSERFIAPRDLISRMAFGANISFDDEISIDSIMKNVENKIPMISTIPMPALLKILGIDAGVDFNYRKIWTISFKIIAPHTKVYQTIYFPADDCYQYRVSITGDEVFVEAGIDTGSNENSEYNNLKSQYKKFICENLSRSFGFQIKEISDPEFYTQNYGKITEIDDDIRKEIILSLSDKYQIYSVGRFATWRNILLDDIVKDVKIVSGFIQQRNNYQRKLNN